MKNSHARRIVAAALAASALVGCRTRDRQVAIDTVVLRIDSAAGQVSPGPRAYTAPTVRDGSAWATGAVLGYAAATNMSAIELGRLAEVRATAPAVKAFAQRMVRDHQAMLKEMNAVASSIGAAPDTAAFDARDAIDDARDEGKSLLAERPGADWDREYIDDAIDSHEEMLDKLRQAARFTTDPRLHSILEQAAAMVSKHLAEAQAIEKGLPRS
jgi:putative membrane protein